MILAELPGIMVAEAYLYFAASEWTWLMSMGLMGAIGIGWNCMPETIGELVGCWLQGVLSSWVLGYSRERKMEKLARDIKLGHILVEGLY
jgi:hypothetical protein